MGLSASNSLSLKQLSNQIDVFPCSLAAVYRLQQQCCCFIINFRRFTNLVHEM
jgi:hypothetical protein